MVQGHEDEEPIDTNVNRRMIATRPGAVPCRTLQNFFNFGEFTHFNTAKNLKLIDQS